MYPGFHMRIVENDNIISKQFCALPKCFHQNFSYFPDLGFQLKEGNALHARFVLATIQVMGVSSPSKMLDQYTVIGILMWGYAINSHELS